MTEASIQDVYTVDEGREEPSTVLVLKAHGEDGYLPIYVSVAPRNGDGVGRAVVGFGL